MKKIKLITIAGIIISVFLLSCGTEYETDSAKLANLYSGKGDGGIVAKIGSYELTSGRLNYMYNTLPPALRRNYDMYGGIERFLVDFTEQKAVALEISSHAIDDYEDISVHIERGIDQALFTQLIEYEAYKKVTDEAIEKYYVENISDFSNPEMVRARHVFVSPEREENIVNRLSDDAVGQAEAKKKIMKIAESIKRGDDFASQAELYSEDGSAANGGDLGYFKKGDMVKPFEDKAFELNPGEVSEIVETDYGFHLIEVLDRKESETMSFNEAREIIRKKLFPLIDEDTKSLFVREQINKSAEKHKIEIFRENISNY